MKMPYICAPAKLYLVISAIAIIMALFNKFSMKSILGKTLFILLWTWILNFLCKKGYKTISWFLVLIPYILIAITMFLVYGKTKKNNMKQKK